MTQEGFPKNGWIGRLAAEERGRDAATARATSAAARGTALVAAHGRPLVEALATMIEADVASYSSEFPDDPRRQFAVDQAGDGSFEVRRTGCPTVALQVTPQWNAGVVACRYQFRPGADLPVREDRFALGFIPHQDEARFKHQDSGEVFTDVHAVSEYLLTPVFLGRPRLG